jgi:TRAP-type C4-dicarboxylate transport system substrate-binding protein
LKEIVEGAFNDVGLKQRDDMRGLNDTLQADLVARGMVLNNTEPDSFRGQLQKSEFYGEWKARFGKETWALLEESAGKPL